MNHHYPAATAVAVALGLASLPAVAEPKCPPGVPAGVGCGGSDLRLATAGTYKVDPGHTSVIAKVKHIGYSYSVFRFGKVDGPLTWDPASPAKSTLTATVWPASIETPVEGFASELSGDKFLNTAAFPQATFKSTAFRPTSATMGKVDGTLSLMGKSRPVVIDVELVGAGSGFGGKPRIGIEGYAAINPQDFGLAPVFDQPIRLVLDVEFEKAS
ncbi:MAG: YceI family protein [Phenylobacterium sp.]|nr:YceI family protein [Phenylobacterium sp.]